MNYRTNSKSFDRSKVFIGVQIRKRKPVVLLSKVNRPAQTNVGNIKQSGYYINGKINFV